MSTRGSLYYHEDKETGVTVHIYHECSPADTPVGLRLEVEHPCGVTNVAWPHEQFVTEVFRNPEILKRWFDRAEPKPGTVEKAEAE